MERKRPFERLNHFIDDKVSRRLLKFFARSYPGEIVDRVVDNELEGRGVMAERVKRAEEWLKEQDTSS